MVTQLADNIWTYQGAKVVFAGAPMHTQMTVVRLSDGQLWVHSPIELSDEVRGFIEGLGSSVAALVAPNKFHYLYVEAWRTAYPAARVFAEEHLMRKVDSLKDAELLSNTPADVYSTDIDQVVFAGSRIFQEVVFFHKPSRTLILTDLFINLKLDGIGWLPRLFLKFEGVVHPNGGTARLFRWLTNDKARAREAFKTVMAWNPERLVFCHGEAFDEDVKTLLAREFSYLE